MKTAITIGYTASGSTKLVSGPDVFIGDQIAAAGKMAAEGTPDGLVKVELWDRDKGLVRTIFAKPDQPKKGKK